MTTCWLLLLPLFVAAQTPPIPADESRTVANSGNKTSTTTQVDPELILELGGSYEHLTNGSPDWQSYFLAFNRKFASGQTLYGSGSAVRRFDQTDPNLMVGFVQPLGDSRSWIATFEGAGSPTHQVLPVFSLSGRIDHKFGAGWVGNAGIRFNTYGQDKVTMGIFGVEKYFKQYRAAYTVYVAHLNGQGTSVSHLGQLNYYYGDRNSVGINVALGQEIESLGEGRLLRTPVTEVSISGRHWINKKWGFSYWGGWHRQGTLYTRSGAQIGLLLRF